MQAYEHATSATKNGYLFIDTSNESALKEKFRVRNFLAPIYAKSNKQTLQNTKEDSDDSIKAIAKKDHQYLYADLNTETPTY